MNDKKQEQDLDDFDEEFDFLDSDDDDLGDTKATTNAEPSAKPKEKKSITQQMGKILPITGAVALVAIVIYFMSGAKEEKKVDIVTTAPEVVPEVVAAKELEPEPKLEPELESELESKLVGQNAKVLIPELELESEPESDILDVTGLENIAKSLNEPENSATKISTEMQETLSSITEEITVNVNQIRQLESTIQELAKTLISINKNIGSMDNRVLSLTETVNNLSQDLVGVKEIIKDEDLDITTRQNFSQPLVYNTPEYMVHAIIPGRAWLKSSAGQIITVTEGDTVGDYGKIAIIDANNNIVRTSSGISFR